MWHKIGNVPSGTKMSQEKRSSISVGRSVFVHYVGGLYGINPYVLEGLIKNINSINSIESIYVCNPIETRKKLIAMGFKQVAEKVVGNTRKNVLLVIKDTDVYVGIPLSSEEGLEGIDCPHWITS